jgi:hypothetical protein
MHWTFSIGWFFGGLLIMAAGGAMLVFDKQISDNIASGGNSYDKVRLAGLITIALGFIFMTNLHSSIFYGIFHLIMPNVFP